jgi:hypothetical protein
MKMNFIFNYTNAASRLACWIRRTNNNETPFRGRAIKDIQGTHLGIGEAEEPAPPQHPGVIHSVNKS